MLEYKFFEPAFYHTDVPDWGTSYAQVAALGERAMVCLDTGHHAPGTNIEFIVAQLLRLGKLGSFDFNSRFYADDDLIVGAADPFQLFRILYEVIRGGGYGKDSGVAFMLDQCHNVEDKIPGQIRSVLNVQEMTARALSVDTEALAAAQQAGDVLGANSILMDAFYTDVRPDLAAWREGRGLPADPMRAYAESGYQKTIETERVGGTQAGWGAWVGGFEAGEEVTVRLGCLVVPLGYHPPSQARAPARPATPSRHDQAPQPRMRASTRPELVEGHTHRHTNVP